MKKFVGKPQGKRPLGKLKRRLEDNIKTAIKETSVWGCRLDEIGS
jgi:hypothetical protein